MDYTKKQIEDLLQGVYSGEINPHELPVDLYEATAKYLVSGLGQIEGNISPAMLNDLRQNLYFFSGAKTYQQIAEMTILKEGDKIKTYSEFKKEALGIYEQYNQNWLKTEYNTTIGQAQMVERWEQIEDQKKTLPLLKYSAVIDPNTSDICRPLDGTVLPVGDKFWAKNSPLNHFNCRCLIIQLEDGDEKVTDAKEAAKRSEEVSKTRNPLFETKPKDTREIFSKDHPYFDVPKKDQAYAQRNFDLPVPEDVYAFKPATSVKEARTMFKEVIEKDLGLKVDKMTFDSALTVEAINDRLEPFTRLAKEYNISPNVNKEKAVNLYLKSTRSAYGYIKRQLNTRTKDVWLDTINLGSKTDSAVARSLDLTFPILKPKSAVDAVNINKATATHEFAHIMGTTSDLGAAEKSPLLEGFFKELRGINEEYSKELIGYRQAKDIENMNLISLGSYSHTNLNEFMAEGFTEYKLHSNPSKYAKQIGELIDKTFKK